MKKRKSLLHDLKPEEIRMLLWWADEYEAIENGTQNRGKYKLTTIALRERLQKTQVNDAITGQGKSLRIEKILLRIIKPYRWAAKMTILKKKWEVNKKQYHSMVVGYY